MPEQKNNSANSPNTEIIEFIKQLGLKVTEKSIKSVKELQNLDIEYHLV